MLNSLQGRLSLLFAAFVTLVIVSVGATYWGLETQRQDALVINLAGRQRMLIQQMTRLAAQWNESREDDELAALREAESTFELTLTALREGGEVPYLPGQIVSLAPTRDPELLEKLNELNAHWMEFHAALEDVILASSSDALQIVQEESTDFVQHADEVVRAYQSASEARMARLRTIQIGFLVSALLLLAVGGWVTSRSLLRPLRRLEGVADRIGNNDLETQVQAEGPREMRLLAQAFESMRVGLRSSRSELLSLNQTLERRVVQRTRELNALNEVSREISSRLELQQVLDSVTDKARSLLHGEVASLCLLDESGQWLGLQALSGPPAAVQTDVVKSQNELTEQILQSDQALLCGTGACVGECSILTEAYRASLLAAPLRIGDRIIGAMCVGSPAQNRFTKESADLLTKLANTAAIALENARLYAQVERVAVLEERQRIAAEMHDGLGQTMSYLGLMTDQVVDFLADGQDVEALERLRRTRITIGRATNEVRRAINSLMNESPLNQNLSEQLQMMLEEFSSINKLPVSWQMDLQNPPPYSRDMIEQALNIVREALANVARHAQASAVAVRMGQEEENYFITIEDDGKGMDPAAIVPGGHFGRRIMHARAEHIGGNLIIEAELGRGTRLTLTWPVSSEAA